MSGTIVRMTRSVCPVCLKNIEAVLTREEDGKVYLKKSCPEHGSFRTLVWQGLVDPELWTVSSEPLSSGKGLSCPGNCGICGEHEMGTCCALLEVTQRCNLRCRFCFADGGSGSKDPDVDEVKEMIRDIVRQCGDPLLQLSGGEPTLRDDLPELVRFAKEAGCSYVQINTNGIRLAEDPAYVQRLKEAGLDIVFLQFDGTREEIYEKLRGRRLLETKLAAIRTCAACGLGVTLVPTVVPGVNDDDLGALVRLAVSLSPDVKGIHFQPVSYFGRIPAEEIPEERYTLDRLMADLSDQAGIAMDSFMPSRCDHPLCGFHADFLISPSGSLKALSSITHSSSSRGTARDNREYVARHWIRQEEQAVPLQTASMDDDMDFDTFLYRLKHNRLTLSSMAFQDAMNLNIERLHRCTLHVYDNGKIMPFCAKYLTPVVPAHEGTN
ncbi:MAG: radical SAM protein [Lachnospiraceae bacterium]|nr:radical SAM protein [Lachnospiraceae bacterium]